MLEKINKTREYLDYLEEHYNNVQTAWEIIKVKCKKMYFMADDFRYFSIQEAVEAHDDSKLSKQEFSQYRQMFYPTDYEKNNQDLQIKIKKNFDEAWRHHIKHNPHHYENWKELEGYPAIEIHVVHNIIDWMAMGIKFGNTAQEYYEKNKDEFAFPYWAELFIYEIFECLEK